MKKDKISLMKELKKERKPKENFMKEGIKFGIGMIGLGIGLKAIKEI